MSDEATVEVKLLPFSTTGFPTFTSTEDSFSLSESITVGHTMTTVQAVATRPGTSVTYLIAGGNVDQSFEVSEIGEVKVAKPLDFEKAHRYSLWIEARDNGSPSLSDYLGLQIDITDENDNPPVFEKLYYNASVTEEEFPPLVVSTVRATDADMGDNGRVTYQLMTTQSAENIFAIDSVSGQIRTVNKLNREEVDHFTLEVEAVDHVSVLHYTRNILKTGSAKS